MKYIIGIIFLLTFTSTFLRAESENVEVNKNSTESTPSIDSTDLSESRMPASVFVEEPNESRIIEMAKHRLYPGGQDEQDLEVQKQLQKPQKSPGSLEEESVEAPVREEGF